MGGQLARGASIQPIQARGAPSVSRITKTDRKGSITLLKALEETLYPRFLGGKISKPVTDRLDEVTSESVWSVYIIRCGDGTLYAGIATDVERRFGEHVSQGPKTAKYLRGRLPLEIVYRKEIGNRSEASKEELRIKRMGLKGKLELVNAFDCGEPTNPRCK